jgi:ectoine hydroxylase-related dioxygenase (phytanoyl-CoA dioxygenase family)
MRGQTVADIEAYKKLPRAKMTVPAGCALVHGPHIIHGSGINKASTDRIAMGMLFVSTECKPVLEVSPESTVMVSGEDKYNYMLHDPRPTGDWEIDVKNWKAAYDRQHDNYYWMQQRCLR